MANLSPHAAARRMSAPHASVPAVVLAESAPPRIRFGWELAKRTLDVLGAALLLLSILPVLAVVALAIRLDSAGPAIFRQTRVGRGGRTFTLLKLRTMSTGASSEPHERYIASLAEPEGEEAEHGLKKLTDDPRVTRVGAFLRRTSLDELPQLLNVVRGHMSIVGPRPAMDYELPFYADAHFERFRVRPGLTGLWQVSGRNALNFHDMLELDTEYAHRFGPLTDARILLQTPRAVLRGHTA
jgi:lipopolysaccharide/colanic/teichoic acid biosynthesis glycosyltransferase